MERILTGILILALAWSAPAAAQLDEQPPEPPTGVTVTPDVENSDRLQVSWTSTHSHFWDGESGDDPEAMRAMLDEAAVSQDEDGMYRWGGVCISYQIGASTTAPGGDLETWFSGTNPVFVAATATNPGQPESGTLGGLSPGTVYYVAVRARNAENGTSISPVVGPVSTSSDLVAPGTINAPTVTVIGPTSVRLGWQATGDDNLSGIARWFHVYVSSAGPVTEQGITAGTAVLNATIEVLGGAGTPHTADVTMLAPGLLYHFAIKAEDEAGNRSTLSATGGPIVGLPQEIESSDPEGCVGSPGGDWTAGGIATILLAAMVLQRRR